MAKSEVRFISLRRKCRGFTLVEILVYVAILAALSVTAVDTLLLINRSLAQIRLTRTINASGSAAMETVTRVIRDAKSVNAGASVFDVSPGVLLLTGSETPALTHRFSVNNGALQYETGVNPAVSLTPPGVIVANLVFRSLSTVVSQAVRIELTLAVSSGRATTTWNFYDTVALRNSYAQ